MFFIAVPHRIGFVFDIEDARFLSLDLQRPSRPLSVREEDGGGI